MQPLTLRLAFVSFELLPKLRSSLEGPAST